jgi:hypothetical protein
MDLIYYLYILRHDVAMRGVMSANAQRLAQLSLRMSIDKQL